MLYIIRVLTAITVLHDACAKFFTNQFQQTTLFYISVVFKACRIRCLAFLYGNFRVHMNKNQK